MNANRPRPFLAVNQHSIPSGLGLGDAFRLAREAGFDGFEPVVRASGELSDGTDDAGVARTAAAARDAGLAVKTLSSDVWFRMPLTDPDPDVRRRALAKGERLVEITARLGAEVLHVIPGMVDMPLARPDYPPVPYDEAYSRATEGVRALARRAESAGVRIGLENVWNRFLQSPLEMRALVDSAGSPAVTAFFDVGNCLAIGYPEHWIRILGGGSNERLARVHFKDFRRAAGITTAAGFVAPLAGDVNWPAVMTALDDVGYAGPLTVEVACGRHQDPAAHLRALADSLRALDAMRRPTSA